jgi:hypothetical protein
LYIDHANQRLGIGTTSPQANLHIKDSTSSSTDYKFYVGRSGSNTNEGLGIAVSDAGSYIRSIQDETGTNAHNLTFEVISSASGNHYHGFAINNSEKMRITSAGAVGIGTTTTSGVSNAKLYVNGGIHLPSNRDISGALGLSPHIGTGNFILYSGNPGGGSEKFRITNAGNVGIGTTSPGAKLDVVGSARFNNLLATNSTNGAAKAFIHVASSAGAAKFKVYKNVNTADGYAYFRIDRAYDYGNNDQMIQEAVYQRRTTTKNVKFKYEGDVATTDDVYLEFYELTDGTVEAWICHDDYAQVGVSINYFESTGDTYPTPSAGTPTGTLIHSTNPDTETPNWDSYQGDGYFAGNVGIGTTSPSYKLDVSGSFRATSESTFTSNLLFPDDARIKLGTGQDFHLYHTGINANIVNYTGDVYIQNQADNKDIIFAAAAGTANPTEILRIDGSSGNVGIGTTSPLEKLHVVGNGIFEAPDTSLSYPIKIYTNKVDAYDRTSGILFNTGYTDPSRGKGALVYDYISSNGWNRGDFHFLQNTVGNSSVASLADSVLTIKNSGNVGIGTTSPGVALQVGDGTVDDAVRSYFNDGNYTEMRGYGLQFSRGFSYIRPTTDNTKSLYIGTSTAQWNTLSMDASTTTFNTNGSENMRITSAGNVGIGTTSPSDKLHISNGNLRVQSTASNQRGVKITPNGEIQQTSSAADWLHLQRNHNGQVAIGHDSTANLYVANNVGIGTTSPSAQLHLLKAGGTLIKLGTSQNTSEIEAREVGSANSLVFSSNNSVDHMTIDGVGNVGIGRSSSITARLFVQGPVDTATISTSSTPAARINNGGAISNWIGSNGYNYGYIQSIQDDGSNNLKPLSLQPLGGNVGIGTTSPGVPLEVNGVNTTSGQGEGLRVTRQGVSSQYISIDEADGSKHRIRAIGDKPFEIFSSSSSYGIKFFTNSTQKATILANGNVGIGTTSPSYKLHVAGKSYLSGGIQMNSGDEIDFGNSNQYITGVNDTSLTLATGGSATLTATHAGNVGIGTSSPTDKLDVSGNIKLKSVSDYIKFANDLVTIKRDGSNFLSLNGYAGFKFYDTQNSSERMRIDSSGNVGIGTTSPGEKLTLQTQATGLGSEGVFIKNPFAGSTPIVNSKSPFLSLATSNSSGYTSTIYMGRNGTATGQESKIEWSNANNGLSIYVAGQGSYREHVRFGDLANSTARTFFNGNVGIGTTSPQQKLDVNGDIAIKTATQLSFNTSNGTLSVGGDAGQLDLLSSSIFINYSGNVGIGTDSPGAKLHIGSTSTSGTTTEEFRLQSGTSSGNGGTAIANLVTGSFGTSGIYFGNSSTYTSQDAYLKYADSNNATTLHFSSSLNLEQGTSGSRMYINSSGNVGIGTTSPATKLEINGPSHDANFTSGCLMIQQQPQGDRIFIDGNDIDCADGILFLNDYSLNAVRLGGDLQVPNGNVGIGTTTPQYQLQLSTNSAAKPTSSAWTVVSDKRVKTNIRPYETGLDKLLQIEPKVFDYNGKAGFDTKAKNNIGVIAQEIKDIMPETVKKYNAKLNEEDEEDTELYNFDSHALTFALINSVKELNAKIKNLETKIQTLENQ